MSYLGLLSYYLEIEVTQTDGDISIKQSAYANKILKEAGMLDCNETLIPMDPGTRLTKVTERTMVNSTEYRSLIGCLRCPLHTRPDLSYSVGLLSRFMQEPREQHMKAIRQLLRYIKGTKDYGITYMHNEGNKIHRFCDSSYRVNTQEGKGTTGIIFYYGESPISWSTQKQATVAQSLCESEFIAAATQALWLKRLLSKLTHSQEEKVIIKVDNKSPIALIKNLVFHRRSKHIDTKYHFIRECVEREDIQVKFVMESLEHTMKRGAPILVEYLGGAINCDAYHMTDPRSDGLGVSSCIQSCLEDVGISVEEVNYINAHATSTLVGDLAEVNAVKKGFKKTEGIKMNATKSMIGHCVGAAGGLEAIATVKAIQTGWLHPSINQFDPEPTVEFDTVANVKQQHEINVAV
nr:ribonuclease H-like domain, reverse transcriptase, RNA-dependent DNA polymerase [Tanacetum cinerariifolium]